MKQINFGDALVALKQGKKLTRLGWRDNMWIKLVKRYDYTISPNTGIETYGEPPTRDFIGLKAHDGSFGTCGLHDRDVLAEDWIIVE